MSETLVSFTDVKSLLENNLPESKCEIWVEVENAIVVFVFSLSKLGRRVTRKYRFNEILDKHSTFEKSVVTGLIADFNEAPMIIL